ncbi:MAG: hypothetical protein IKQ84_05190, partial [Spirochaetaceae bacterium]|nr:hypothetical protein [Spirochaetaceae bacterium]
FLALRPGRQRHLENLKAEITKTCHTVLLDLFRVLGRNNLSFCQFAAVANWQGLPKKLIRKIDLIANPRFLSPLNSFDILNP